MIEVRLGANDSEFVWESELAIDGSDQPFGESRRYLGREMAADCLARLEHRHFRPRTDFRAG